VIGFANDDAVPELKAVPTLSVVGVISELDEGSSKPLLVSTHGERGDPYVLKLCMAGNESTSPSYLACARELICNQLARLCGVRVAPSALLHFTSELLANVTQMATTAGVTVAWHARACANPLGPHFGSLYLGRGKDVGALRPIRSEAEAIEYLNLLAFDLFVWNGDRTVRNTNLREHGSQLFAIDFAMAQMPLPSNRRSTIPLVEVEQHATVPGLRAWYLARRAKRTLPIAPMLGRWRDRVTPVAVDTILAGVPKEWDVPPSVLSECRAFLLSRAGYTMQIQSLITTVLAA
jgi:hypothetical protein